VYNGLVDEDICFQSAVEMARRIRAKQISSRELLEAHLKRIERINPTVNAIVTLVAEQAMEQARFLDEAAAHGRWAGPLHGLPVAHKDLHETMGIRTTFGSPLLKDNVPVRDEIFIERMKRAGAITIGKTNTPEFGAGSQTFNPVFGATKNPYDLTKTCGGSSGGAAVSLACGMIPLADGSDMGGSLRNPASFCNVVGLRTAAGRVPTYGGWLNLSVAGPMARTVADTALMLSVMAGPDDRCPIALDEPGSTFGGPLERVFEGIRIAWPADIPGMIFDPEVRLVVDEQRRTFEELGCVVEDALPDLSGADEVFRTLRAWTFELALGAVPGPFKETIREEIERGRNLTGPELGKVEKLRLGLYDRMRVFMTDYEFLLLPTVQVPPFDVNQAYPAEINGVKMESYIDWMRSCYYISAAGNPAISVPCGFTSSGLPVGLQIVGRHRAEFAVLQLAHAFELATGFGKNRPPA
jgi:amidase